MLPEPRMTICAACTQVAMKGSPRSGTTIPMAPERRTLRLRATSLGLYPSCWITAFTLAAVRSLT